jgi:hypothetical protein
MFCDAHHFHGDSQVQPAYAAYVRRVVPHPLKIVRQPAAPRHIKGLRVCQDALYLMDAPMLWYQTVLLLARAADR